MAVEKRLDETEPSLFSCFIPVIPYNALLRPHGV
jgi:hypothetical protein